MVEDIRKIVKRALSADFFLYDNGHKITPSDQQKIRGILLDAIEGVEAIKKQRKKDKDLL